MKPASAGGVIKSLHSRSDSVLHHMLTQAHKKTYQCAGSSNEVYMDSFTIPLVQGRRTGISVVSTNRKQIKYSTLTNKNLVHKKNGITYYASGGGADSNANAVQFFPRGFFGRLVINDVNDK
jgi:hypothetical protein